MFGCYYSVNNSFIIHYSVYIFLLWNNTLTHYISEYEYCWVLRYSTESKFQARFRYTPTYYVQPYILYYHKTIMTVWRYCSRMHQWYPHIPGTGCLFGDAQRSFYSTLSTCACRGSLSLLNDRKPPEIHSFPLIADCIAFSRHFIQSDQ